MTLTLYAKAGCHLCDDLRALLTELRSQYQFTFTEIDILNDPALYQQYRHAVPVLFVDEREVARGRVNEADVISALDRHASREPGP